MGENKTMKAHNFIDISGNRFGKLIVKEFVGRINKRSLWLCVCDCGKVKTVESSNLKSGQTKSCGCIRKEISVGLIPPSNKKHGLSSHKLYAVHQTMIARCYNPNNHAYDRYGGRGIIVCERWHSFNNFYEDMVGSYKEGLTLERVNTNGNYEKSNCKWDTYKNQARNTRANRIVSYKEIIAPIAQICESLNKDAKIVYRRIRDGWSVTEAIETPIMASKINYSKRK